MVKFSQSRYLLVPIIGMFMTTVWATEDINSINHVGSYSEIAASNSITKETLSLKQAIVKTLKSHPDLSEFVYHGQTAEAELLQSSVKSPMQLEITADNFLGTGEYRGLSGVESEIGVSWLLNEESLLDSRTALARSKQASIDVNKQIKALELAAETANIYVKLLSQQEQLKLAQLALSQAKNSLFAIAERVKAGQTSQIDQFRREADIARKDLVVEDLIHEIKISQSQLAAQWQGSDNIMASGNFFDIPEIDNHEIAKEKLIANPRLAKFATQKRILQSEINLAKTEERPIWTLSAGIKRNEAIDDTGFTVGFSRPLKTQGRNRYKVASLQAKERMHSANERALQARLETQLDLILHKLRHDQHVIQGLEEKVIPVLKNADSQAQEAYQRGRYSYSDLNQVQEELLYAQLERLQAYVTLHTNIIELERLTGASLSQ